MNGLINIELAKRLCCIQTTLFAKDMFQVKKALEFKILKKLCPGSDTAASCDTIFLAPRSQDNNHYTSSLFYYQG